MSDAVKPSPRPADDGAAELGERPGCPLMHALRFHAVPRRSGDSRELRFTVRPPIRIAHPARFVVNQTPGA